MSLYLTVHPFGDEWLWDKKTNGEKPAVFGTIEDAVIAARQAREDYIALVGPGSNWETTFWSAVYDSIGDHDDYEWSRPEMYDGGASRLMGYVDPGGEFHKCFDSTLVPTTPDGGYRA